MGIAIGRTVEVTRFVAGYPSGLCTGAWVEIVARQKLGKAYRYQVKSVHGALFWVDADAIIPLGGP